MINILTRTHNRPKEFQILRSTLETQTYKDYNWIVGSDTKCDYYDALPLIRSTAQPIVVPMGMYFAPWNLYLETLAAQVKEGYVMYIDDDDMFSYENSLEVIAQHCDENTLLVWKVRITPTFIVPSHSFGKGISAGDISGIGFCFHSKHLPVEWGNLSYGDYRVAKQLQSKLKIKWLDFVLTETQNGARNGK